ncbi:Clavaminate synthase-like protein [Agrocybe pediades]|nr:Clavaminate synthase-like protein [Agrocybe pediades]
MPPKRRANRNSQPTKEESPPHSPSPDESHTTAETGTSVKNGSAEGKGDNASVVTVTGANGGAGDGTAAKRVKEHGGGDEDRCPACTAESRDLMDRNGSRKEQWIACDHCKTWYHWRCAGNGEDIASIAKWYCKTCTDTDPTRIMTLKAPARKSSRKRIMRDYASLNDGLSSDPTRFMRMINARQEDGEFRDPFKRMKGNDLNDTWLEEDEDALREPIVIEQPDGLGMKMPPKDLTVEHVAEYIGEDVTLEVMDVATQSNAPGWDLGKWADYWELEPSKRDKVLNVISLEISGTELADMVLPPKIVRDLDWVENFWPSTRKGKNNAYPKVQLYCLMGVAGAWTDWHIDFAGSSVYYHILHGSKVFYFIRPTPANLAAYEKWSGSELQYQAWLGDMVDEVYKVELVEGNTMIIPTGWIHAVHTPKDTVVFGGNFLHSYDVATQLRVREIEMNTHVPKKFTFPLFSKLCWYVGDKYLRDLKAATSKTTYSPRELNGILTLAEFLVSEARVLEKGSDQAKKEVKDSIPGDRIKDGPAMARELRWRVRQAMGNDSDDESIRRPGASGGTATGNKRRRVGEEEGAGHFRNFKPKVWDAVVAHQEEPRTEEVKVRRPAAGEDLRESWMAGEPEDESETGQVVTTVDKVVKVRRTARGVERHLISRQVEDWTW